jgi:hypothetical protein
VVAIVAAQEVQKVFMGYQRGKDTHGKAVNFGFDKADRAVTVYYFYVLDGDFGPGFIKLCSYFPYPAKVWLNGHEWAKRQAPRPAVHEPDLGLAGVAVMPDDVGSAITVQGPGRAQPVEGRQGGPVSPTVASLAGPSPVRSCRHCGPPVRHRPGHRPAGGLGLAGCGVI